MNFALRVLRRLRDFVVQTLPVQTLRSTSRSAGEAPFVVAEGRVDAGLDYRPSLPVVRAGAVVASVSPVPPTGLTATARFCRTAPAGARGSRRLGRTSAESAGCASRAGSIPAELKGVEKALRVPEGAAAPQGAAAGVGTDAGALVVVRRHPIAAAPAAVHRPVESVASAASAPQRDATAEPLLAPRGRWVLSRPRPSPRRGTAAGGWWGRSRATRRRGGSCTRRRVPASRLRASRFTLPAGSITAARAGGAGRTGCDKRREIAAGSAARPRPAAAVDPGGARPESRRRRPSGR